MTRSGSRPQGEEFRPPPDWAREHGGAGAEQFSFDDVDFSDLFSRFGGGGAASRRRAAAGPGLRSAGGNQPRRRVSRHHVVAVAVDAGVRRRGQPAARSAQREGAHRARRCRWSASAPARQGWQRFPRWPRRRPVPRHHAEAASPVSRHGPRPVPGSAARAVGSGARRHGGNPDAVGTGQPQGAGGHLGRAKAAARGPRAAEAARRRGRSHRGGADRGAGETGERERELYQQLAEASSFNPRRHFAEEGA